MNVCLRAAILWIVSQGNPQTPVEQYQALLKEFQKAPREECALKFLELAEKYPKDPIAREALIQSITQVNSSIFPKGGKESPGERALAILRRDHLQSDSLGALCQQISFGFHRSHEAFLRAVLEMNPHREVQGLACLSLAQFINNRIQRLDVLDSQDKPELAERYQRAFGRDLLEELKQQDRAAVEAEIETLFVRAAEEFGDVKIPVTYFGSGGLIQEKAESELFQIRHLAVGKVAPEIEGVDQDNHPFKLSDYRGKVVLLDFWHHL